MFEFARFVTRNPLYSQKNWRGLSQVRRAMKAHKLEFPVCEMCGDGKAWNRSIETHHIVPVSVDPLKAGEYSNFITLCRKHHLYVGHNGNFRSRYDANIIGICEAANVVQISP